MVSVIPALERPNSPTIRGLSPLGKTLVAVGTYVGWTVVTWLLEGRIRTLLRPEATVDRVVYTGVANVLVGTVLALWLVREFVAADFSTRRRFGFRSPRYTLAVVTVAVALGLGLYLSGQPPSTDPVVVANAFAQVLPVSIAEIVVCWVLVGGSVVALLRGRVGERPAAGVGVVVASALFGAYHFAHSPPFDTPAMVALLTVVGVGTSLVYFGGRSAYGALAFHNLLALRGVTAALADAGQLGAYRTPRPALIVTALVAFAVFVAGERWIGRLAGETTSKTGES